MLICHLAGRMMAACCMALSCKILNNLQHFVWPVGTSLSSGSLDDLLKPYDLVFVFQSWFLLLCFVHVLRSIKSSTAAQVLRSIKSSTAAQVTPSCSFCQDLESRAEFGRTCQHIELGVM